MYPVKQSTSLEIDFFAFDANGDGVTGIADGSWTKRIKKSGGAWGAMTVTISEGENGWYTCTLSTSHTDTLGVLSVSFSAASVKRVNLQFRVHARVPDDLAFPTTSGRSIDVTATGAVGIDWGNVEGQATSVTLSSTTISTVTAAVTVGTNNDKTGYALSAAGVDAILDEPLAAHTTADTPGQVLNMLTQDSVNLSTDVALGSIIGQLLDNGTAWSYDRTTDSLEAIRDRGDVAWITATGFSTHSAADVWTSATRTLTSAANITSTGGTTVPQTGDSFARLGAPAGASVSADVAAVKSDTAAILLDTGTDGVVISTATQQAIADAYLDRSNAIETGLTPRGAFRLVCSANAGKLSGAATTTVTIRNAVADSKDRITATVDASGNRTAVVTDVT